MILIYSRTETLAVETFVLWIFEKCFDRLNASLAVLWLESLCDGVCGLAMVLLAV